MYNIRCNVYFCKIAQKEGRNMILYYIYYSLTFTPQWRIFIHNNTDMYYCIPNFFGGVGNDFHNDHHFMPYCVLFLTYDRHRHKVPQARNRC